MIEARTYGPLRHTLAQCLAQGKPGVVRDLAQHIADLMNQLEATMVVRDKLRTAEIERQETSKRQLAALSSLTGLTSAQLDAAEAAPGPEPVPALSPETLRELSSDDDEELENPILAQYLTDVAAGLTDPDAVNKPPFTDGVSAERPDSRALLTHLVTRDRGILDDLATDGPLDDPDNEELEL